jgi:hypothetical protein
MKSEDFCKVGGETLQVFVTVLFAPVRVCGWFYAALLAGICSAVDTLQIRGH